MEPKYHIRSLAIIFGLAMLLSTSGCNPQMPILNEKDNGTTLEISNGEMFGLILPGNPTTGYSWTVVSAPNPAVRSIGKYDFTPDTKAVGSGGNFSFLFGTLSPGQAKPKMAYCRPWEKKLAEAKTFEVNVVVK